jgi:Tol biopolymer transport system component
LKFLLLILALCAGLALLAARTHAPRAGLPGALPLRELTFDEVNSETAINEFPVASPDGRYLTFQHSEDPHRTVLPGGRTMVDFDDASNWDVYRIRTDGSERVRLTDSPAVEDQAGWSPDSKTLVYRFKNGKRHQLWLMDADGAHKRPLVQLPKADAKTPVFSDDGKKVLFFSDKDGVKWNLYTVELVTGTIERVTHDQAQDKHPQFVPPAGQLVTFHSTRGSAPDIALLKGGPVAFPLEMMNVFRLDRESGEIINLSHNGPGDDCRHSWPSPDGRFVAFHCNQFEPAERAPYDGALDFPGTSGLSRRLSRDIWIADIDGSKKVCLTCGDGRKFKHPSWNPQGTGLYVVFKGRHRAWNVGFVDAGAALRALKGDGT